MKKIICLCLTLVMVFGLVACGNKTEEVKPTESTPVEDVTVPTPDATEGTEGTESEVTTTVAETLAEAFKTAATAEDATVETIVAELSTNATIPFMAMTQEMEPGYLAGFDVEITNFDKCYTMCPAIGSIPFVSYVFTLEDGADAEAFVKTLEDNHNLRWNICVTAEQMLTVTEGDFIFFVMAPNAFETEEPEVEETTDVTTPETDESVEETVTTEPTDSAMPNA